MAAATPWNTVVLFPLLSLSHPISSRPVCYGPNSLRLIKLPKGPFRTLVQNNVLFDTFISCSISNAIIDNIALDNGSAKMPKSSHNVSECEDIRKPHTIPRGLLRILIIRLLHSHEMTGTEIMEQLSERSQGDWRPSPGSIYPLLASLEEDGIIEPAKTEGRSKTYRIAPDERERTKEILKRHDVELKARLGRMMWLQLLEPADRVHFHFGGIRFALDSIDETIDSLSKSELRKVRTLLGKARDNIETLLERINKGEAKND